MNLEREIKLDAPAWFRLPELAGDPIRAERERERTFLATYVDTPDLRILRWGASLRHRTGEGWTVKLPATSDGRALARAEHTFAGDDVRRLPRAAADLVAAFVRTQTLAPVAQLRTSRREIEVTDGQRALATLTDDDVEILRGSSVVMRFRELEVELADAVEVDDIEELLARLRRAGAKAGDGRPKVHRAVADGGPLDPEVAIPDVPSDPTVADVVRAAIATSVVRLITNDPGVRLGEDAEAVHQARVATRRLRSDLRTFRNVLDEEPTRSLREQLRWLGDALGEVRDLDVLREGLERHARSVLARDRPAARAIVSALDAQREQARERLLAAYRERRYLELLETIVDTARSPALRRATASRRARDELRDPVARQWAHLERAVDAAERDGDDDVLHAARIRAKRARYAAEAVAPAFGKRARRFASAAADLQDVLGEHHDAVVAVAFLREQASVAPDAFVAGELAGLELAARRRTAETWLDAWKALDRKRLRFWR